MPDRLVVVDGYNIILRTPALRPGGGRTLRQSRAKLLSLLAWAVDPGVRFLVVFDGADVRSRDSSDGPPRKYYRLTPAGRRALGSFENEWRLLRAAVDGILEGGGR